MLRTNHKTFTKFFKDNSFIIKFFILLIILVIPISLVIFSSFNKIEGGYIVDSNSFLKIKLLYINDYQLMIATSIASIFAAYFTIVSVIFAYRIWVVRDFQKHKSHVNALIEEIRYNLNVLGKTFIEFNENETYGLISSDLKNFHDNTIYPCIGDNLKKYNDYFSKIRKRDFSTFDVDKKAFFPLSTLYLDNAISTENLFSLKYHRLFINFSHLKYSIKRHNLLVDSYNNIHRVPANDPDFFRVTNALTNKCFNIQENYISWLHLRLNYMLIDIIQSIDERYFIDIDFVHRIKNKIKGV